MKDQRLLAGIIVVTVFLWCAYAYQYCGANRTCGLESLKEWQGLIGGAMTIVAALIGGYFVVQSTNRQMRLIADQFQETNRPFVVAKLSTRAGVVFVLEIENIGRTPATDLNFEIDKNFFQFASERNLKNFPAFNQKIPQFAPGEKLSFDLSQGFNMDNTSNGGDLTPHQFSVTTKYMFEKKSYSERYDIDVEHYFSTTARKNASDHLEDISAHLKKISQQK